MAITKRNQVKQDLESKIELKKLTSPVYRSQLDQYMKWYDQLQNLNRLATELAKDSRGIRAYTECLKEARQLQKAMQGILDWMGIIPAEEETEDDSELEL